MKIYDRLYGEISLPTIIQDLLDCPGLLRLRDVRMANNQFIAFPAFANASRFEHSIGVCHLASICAKSLSLSEKDTIELMIACLYHDVGTPPFAHAMEEVLQATFGFDHESNMKQILLGTNDTFAGNLEQVYLGKAIKLRSICHSKQGRRLGLDVYRIAKIISGDHDEPLSPLLNGNGMDLDNIDNVIRASSAMGIIKAEDIELAPMLASSFSFDDCGHICYNGCYLQEIKRWQKIRDIQYSAIFDSVDDFAYQTMIKKALNLLLADTAAEHRLSKNSWKLTDAGILHEYLLKSSASSWIIERVLLCQPFHCLGILYVQGRQTVKFINSHLDDIELSASSCLCDLLGIQEGVRLNTNIVVANFYPDKRRRALYTEAVIYNQKITIDECDAGEDDGVLLGLFTPLHNSGYKSFQRADGTHYRKKVSFRGNDLDTLIKQLKCDVLSNFNISIYRGSTNEQTNTATAGDQLGFL